MALVPVRGVAVNVGEQTGDGRYIVPGAVSFAEPPLPIAWLRDGDQHTDVVMASPWVGNMTALAHVPGGVAFEGHIDDATSEGAELVRRMREGSSSNGHRTFVSIDSDGWSAQLVDPNGASEGGMVLLAASGEDGDWAEAPRRALASLTAAVGGGDPLAGGGTVVFEDASDAIIARFTQLRIRGLTCCAVSAFTGSYLELADEVAPVLDGGVVASAGDATEGAGPESGSDDAPEADEPLTAASGAASGAVKVKVDLGAPPAAWFEDPGLRFPTPMTITNEGRLLGHIATWGTCHTGVQDRCVPPPRQSSYDRFHVGETVCSDGSRVATGVFAWGIPHADLTLAMIEAWAHYADARHGFGRTVVGTDEHGIWFSGALYPGVDQNDVVLLRSLAMSGDWRRDPRNRELSLIAALAVNFPGYPIPRAVGGVLTAAAGGHVDQEEWEFEAAEPTVRLEGDDVLALVACGMVPPKALTADCGCGDPDPRVGALEAEVARLNRVLGPILPLIADRLDERLT